MNFATLAASSALLSTYILKRNFASKQKKIVLHLYDHCPFCVRVELVLGWKNIKFERKLYGYGDIEGPTRLTGKKMLPVLEYYDETGTKKLMPESLDIIKLLTKEPQIYIYKSKSSYIDVNIIEAAGSAHTHAHTLTHTV